MDKKFDIYYDELVKWNVKHKLTGHTERKSVNSRLFDDAILSFASFDLSNKTLLDVGAGAGFPSVPLLINNPSIKLTIVESMKKRTDFLEHLKNKLDIKFNILNMRVEEFDKKHSFDIVTARAVAKLNILLELTIPFLRVGGHAIYVKGPKAPSELTESKNAISLLGIEYLETRVVNIPGGFENHIIIFKKTKKTRIDYPRIFSKIKSNPL